MQEILDYFGDFDKIKEKVLGILTKSKKKFWGF